MSGMRQNLKLLQTQSLRMTPQLQQAIKLLQMSRMEFEMAIRKEMEENPILEEILDTQEENDPKTEGDRQELQSGETDSADPRKQEEFDWENYIDSTYKPNTDSGAAINDELLNYENMVSSEKTLSDHLIWQLGLFGFNKREEQVLAHLIDYIENDGYIKTPLQDIAKDVGISVEELEENLPLLHEFDPPGVGARDLKECLLVQAKQLEEDTNDLVEMINSHLSDLEKKNYPAISKALKRDIEDIKEMAQIILKMEPKPGRAFSSSQTQYVTPDVYIYKVGDDYVISLNEDGMPRLRISHFYRNALKEASVSGGAQDYIKEKLKSAVFLIRSIHQRQRTIYKVTDSIIKYQRDFFDKGPRYIRPMILRDIATDVGVHESTVSRVTANKYVRTPRGIFELKYFFNSGISSTSGESLASESVKMKIKDLIQKEDPKNPVSDQKVVEALKKEGVQIARRTVSKYRDVMGILPSSKRKRLY